MAILLSLLHVAFLRNNLTDPFICIFERRDFIEQTPFSIEDESRKGPTSVGSIQDVE